MSVPPPEWSHVVARDAVARTGPLHLIADAPTRTRLAVRLGLEALDRLEAQATLSATAAGVRLDGRVTADVVQSCAATGLPVPTTIDEPFHLLFVEALADGDGDIDEEGIELATDECDLVEMDDARIDVAEAAVQSLALALPPFPRHPDADRVLREKGVKAEGEAGPFAGLSALKGLK